jgi:hypothetical protein
MTLWENGVNRLSVRVGKSASGLSGFFTFSQSRERRQARRDKALRVQAASTDRHRVK